MTDSAAGATVNAPGQLLVVGSGTMGTQIALQAAFNGIRVALSDNSQSQLEKAQQDINTFLGRRIERNRLTLAEATEVQSRMTLTSEFRVLAPQCSWAIEAIVERVEPKREVFEALASCLPPSAGMATNSSHIRAATISEGFDWAPRCLNMHFFHPVLVMDLVEVVASPYTSEEFLAAALELSRQMARTPVLLRRDLDGFLVNRILGQASREAFNLLAQGVASFPDIDLAVRRGLRWPLGPFELADLSGLDVLFQSRSDRYERHGDSGDLATIQILQPLLRAGRQGRKSGAGFYDYSGDPPFPLAIDGLEAINGATGETGDEAG